MDYVEHCWEAEGGLRTTTAVVNVEITSDLHKKDSLIFTFLLSLVIHPIAGSMENSCKLGTEGNILNLIKNLNKEQLTSYLMVKNLKLSH